MKNKILLFMLMLSVVINIILGVNRFSEGEVESYEDIVPLQTENTNWDDFEDQLYHADSFEKVIELYYSNLDGAYSEGYSAVVYDYYLEMGADRFIKVLAEHGNRYNTYGIVSYLTMEMDLYFSNDGDIDLLKIKEDIESVPCLTNKEKSIAYQILSNIDEIRDLKRRA